MTNLIQWPMAKYWTDQWNPYIGCKPISPACANCYAAAWAKRFGQSFEPHQSKQETPPNRGVVFVGNMTDLFGEWVEYPDFYIGVASGRAYALGCGRVPPTYLWLTKRAERMANVLSRIPSFPMGLGDIHYFGFTAENQEWFNKRCECGRVWPYWAQGWLSAEPLLGPIDMGGAENDFRWVVVGCESGPNRRPCKLEWVERIVEQCRRADTPVFVKQICLPDGRFTNKIEEFPEHLRIRQVPWAGRGGEG